MSCNRLVEFVDIYPSLCEAAGLPIPSDLDGRSFVPLLKDRALPWKSAAFTQFLREGKWVAPDGIAYMGRSIRTDRYRYVRWRRKDTGALAAEELYDHQTDPLETVNVAPRPENRPLVAALAKQLDAGWRETLPEQYSQ